MSNFAAVIAPLVISGSRLSDGTPNASGIANFFVPGTNTPQTVYSDAAATVVVSQPVTLDSGGRISVSDFPNGIYATAPVRLFITTSAGATVTDTTLLPGSAGNVGVSNAGWTSSTVDGVLTKIFASLGGQDATYREKSGASARLIQDKFREIGVSVKDYGAVGNGIAIDTTAIQSAINEAVAIGGIVSFPPGTFKIDQLLTASSASGLRLVGAGQGATTISQTNGAAGIFAATSCTDIAIERMTVGHATSSSAAAVAFVTSTRPTIDRVTATGFAYGATFTGPAGAANATISGSYLTGATNAVLMTNIAQGCIINSQLNNVGGTALQFAGSTGFVYVGNTIFAAITGVLWQSGITGQYFTVVGCPTLGQNTNTPFDLSALAINPRFRQWGNQVDGYATTVASGGTITPTLSRGPQINIRGTSTGSAFTVAEPTPRPSGDRDIYAELTFQNNAGGAITGWTMNAAHHLSAGPSTTDGQFTSYRLKYDVDNSVWREVSRAVTT